MARSRHPKKEIEEAIRHAEDNGWRVELAGVTHGAKSIAPIMMSSADVENFASQAFGAHRRTRAIMHDSSSASSIIARHINE
jgi:hypothetical protein